jgi:alkylhydroperoxidase family enzyme
MRSMARVEPLPPEEWSELLRHVLAAAPGGVERPMNVLTTLGRHEDLFEAWIRFGGWLLTQGSLPARDRELAILRTACHSGSPYEWAQHARLGRAAGLDDDEIEAARRPLGQHPWSESDRVLLTSVDELHAINDLTEETWQALAERYDEQQRIELPMLVGHYMMVACTLNALRVQVE